MSEPLLSECCLNGSDVCVENVRLALHHGRRGRGEWAECRGVALLPALVQLDDGHLGASVTLVPVRVLYSTKTPVMYSDVYLRVLSVLVSLIWTHLLLIIYYTQCLPQSSFPSVPHWRVLQLACGYSGMEYCPLSRQLNRDWRNLQNIFPITIFRLHPYDIMYVWYMWVHTHTHTHIDVFTHTLIYTVLL